MKRSRSQANITVTAEAAPKRRRSVKRSQKFPRNGVSKTARAKLRYCEEVSLSSNGISTVTRYVFAVNSLFDPNVTGTGNQPVGFDEWMNLYNLYTVVGGQMTVAPLAATTASATPQYFATGISDGQILTSATVQSLLSNCPNNDPGQPFSAYGMNKGFTNVELKERSRSVKWSAGGIMGVAQSDVLDRTSLQGSSTSSPSDLIYGTILIGDVGGAAASTQPYLVTIDFDVVFTNPKQLTIS